MRHWLWFIVAGLAAVGGLVAAFLYLSPRIGAVDAGMQRVVVPGSAGLQFDKPGAYTIFHEQRSLVDGRYYESTGVSGLAVALVQQPSGAAIRLVRPSFSSEYSIGVRHGTSFLVFTLDRPGAYLLTTALPDGRDEPKTVLAIGQSTMGAMFSLIGTALAIAGSGFAIALAIVAVTLRQRNQAKKD